VHVDKLASSRSVERIDADGVVFTDGKQLLHPGIATLPMHDDTLAESPPSLGPMRRHLRATVAILAIRAPLELK
jgi:hypothetical protein